jgi:hypothetical protein
VQRVPMELAQLGQAGLGQREVLDQQRKQYNQDQ